MQFIYAKFAGEQSVKLNVKEYAHIFKVRRVAVGTQLDWRNLIDDCLYTYKIESITKKEAILTLKDVKKDENITTCNLHVGWCIVDTKTVEKNIAMLNEMGITKVTFVYAKFSQRSYKIDKDRLERILINSCEQCGRNSIMKIEVLDTLEEYFEHYSHSAIIDFSKNSIDETSDIKSFLVGPEGGFSKSEREMFKDKKIYGLKSKHILKSETVVVGVCAKLCM